MLACWGREGYDMSTPLVETSTPRDPRTSAPKHRPTLAVLGGALVLLGMGTVQQSVGLTGTLVGGIGTSLLINVEVLIAIVLAGLALARSGSLAALVPGIAVPALSYLWIYYAFCMPGTLRDGPRENAYGKLVGDYPAELGWEGNLIVGLSIVAVLLTCWLFVDRRVRWYVRVLAVLGVAVAHALVVLWLRTRCGI